MCKYQLVLMLSFIDCQSTGHEPMEGLRHLVIGAAQCCLGHYEEAKASFRTCLAKRGDSEHASGETQHSSGDHHISAFALYELGTLLCKDVEVKSTYNIRDHIETESTKVRKTLKYK